MSIKNMPSLADLQADPALAKGLTVEVVALLLKEADDTRKLAEAAKKALTTNLQERFAPQIAEAFRAADKDYGVVHVAVDGFDLELDRAKKVEWDQAGLATLRAQIAAGGDDPDEFIKLELKVEEKRYASWPSMVRRPFEALRVTKPGSVTVALTRLEAAALAA